jgi:hypothetical protein
MYLPSVGFKFSTITEPSMSIQAYNESVIIEVEVRVDRTTLMKCRVP